MTRNTRGAALARARKLHERVEGELLEDVGPFAKGSSYSSAQPSRRGGVISGTP